MLTMEVSAKLRNVRISPRKARLVIDLVRGKQVQYALDQLQVNQKRAAPLLAKLLKSAVSNAERSDKIDVDTLYIKSIYVNPGSMLKRFIPRAQGRATPVRKRMSHINVILAEK